MTAIQGQPRQIVPETSTPKLPQQKWAGGVVQVQSSEFKPQSFQKKLYFESY
jgi:hypothetical protein